VQTDNHQKIKMFSQLLLWGKKNRLGSLADTCNPTYSGDRDQEDLSQGQPGQIVCETLSQKYPTQKRAGGEAQVVEYLLSEYEALSSSHSTTPPKESGLGDYCSPL
jgi:hypothetical protein